MNKPIIIDGVDVSKCEFFQSEDEEYTCKAEEGAECAVVACRSCYNCYFKQLQRLKAENESLKNELKAAKMNRLTMFEQLDIVAENKKLKQALEKIRETANIYLTDCQGFRCEGMENILKKIIEVQNE